MVGKAFRSYANNRSIIYGDTIENGLIISLPYKTSPNTAPALLDMKNHPEDCPQSFSRKFLYFAVVTGNLLSVSGGISLTWSSPVSPKLTNASRIDENPFGEVITADQVSWIGSFLAVGAIFGPFLAGFLADKIGRKYALMLCSGVCFTTSFLILAFSKTIWLYYLARFLGGIGAGGICTVLPNFIAEMSEDSNRGAMTSTMNMFCMIGTMFSYVVGPYTSVMVFSLLCAVVPATATIILFLFVPETPYYLVSVNEDDSALLSLTKLRSSSSSRVEKELEAIKTSVETDKRNQASFLDIFKARGLIKGFITALALVCFQQFSGINIILFYTENIFIAAGTTIPSEIATMIVGAVQVASSLVTPFVADRAGRKILLIISGIGMMLAEAPLGLYYFLQDEGKDVSAVFWLPILCLVFYIILYNLGFGCLPWTVMAEVFPSNIKASASTIIVSFSWVIGFILTRFFEPVTQVIGMGGSFWLFSGFCLLGAIFVFVYVIETKGKSFQEIQEMLAK